MTRPRILPVHDFGEDKGWTYIVMAHMGGGSLADRIRQFGNGMSLGEETIEDEAEQIAVRRQARKVTIQSAALAAAATIVALAIR